MSRFASAMHSSSLITHFSSLWFFGPIRFPILTLRGQLLQIRSVGAHSVDLPMSAAIRLEGDPSSVGRPRRLFVRSFAGDDAALAGDGVGDANLKASVHPRG